jgi:hypothetical protein
MHAVSLDCRSAVTCELESVVARVLALVLVFVDGVSSKKSLNATASSVADAMTSLNVGRFLIIFFSSPSRMSVCNDRSCAYAVSLVAST